MSETNPARAFFVVHVLPAARESAELPDDLRLAMIAAVAVNQMADHFWHAYQGDEAERVFGTTTVKGFRAELAKRQPEWAVIRDVAEAHKHVRLDRPSRTLTSASQTEVRTTPYGAGAYGAGPYGGTPSLVVALDNGQLVHFPGLLTKTVAMWEALTQP